MLITLLYVGVVLAFAFAMFGVWVSNNQEMAEKLLGRLKKKKSEEEEDTAETGKKDKKKGLNLDNAGSTYDFLEFDKINKGMISFKKDPDYFVMGLGIQGVNINMYTEAERLTLKNGFTSILNTLKDETQFLVQSRYVDLSENFNYFKPVIEESSKEVDRLQERIKDEKSDVVKQKMMVKARNMKAKNDYAQHIIDFFDYYVKESKCIQINVYMLTSYRYIPKNNFSFSEGKIAEEAYSVLSNRVKLFQEQFSAMGLKAHALDSIEMADIIYSTLVKNESAYMKLEDALKNGLLDIAVQDIGMEIKEESETQDINYKDDYPYSHSEDISAML